LVSEVNNKMAADNSRMTPTKMKHHVAITLVRNSGAVICQSVRERHALLLAAGQFARIAIGQRGQPRGGEDGSELLGDGVAVQLSQLEAVDDVFGHRQVRPQRVALEDHRHVAPLGRQRMGGRGDQLVADANLAFARFDEAGDQPQRGGLAATRGAEQANQMAVLDGERDIVHHRDIAVSLGQAAQLDGRHTNPPLCFYLSLRGAIFMCR
jgi:hypothetical protein